MMKTCRAKRWGSTVTFPLTNFLTEGKLYDIFEAMFEGEKIIIIRESKVPKISADSLKRDYIRDSRPREEPHKAHGEIPLV